MYMWDCVTAKAKVEVEYTLSQFKTSEVNFLSFQGGTSVVVRFIVCCECQLTVPSSHFW